MFYLRRKFSFDAAHRLPYYEGKCFNLHGHRVYGEIEFFGVKQEETGMVVDFGELKHIVDKKIVSLLDHSYLNDTINNPTAENICEWIYSQLEECVKDNYNLKITKIKLWETPNNLVIYIPRDSNVT